MQPTNYQNFSAHLALIHKSLTLLQSEVCNAFALAAVTKISANTI